MSWGWAAAGSALLIPLVLNAWGDATPAGSGTAGHKEPSHAPKGSFIPVVTLCRDGRRSSPCACKLTEV